LLTIARDSIQHGLANSSSLRVSVEELPEVLLVQRGVFVTLTLEQKLRGCIGNMAATDPLPVAVSDAAFSAAFRDPRFTPLEAEELPQTRIEISVLSPSEALAVDSREQLLEQLVPGVDGLVLRDGRHRATFLPKVWEQLPVADAFLEQLLHKAGLPGDHWSETLCFERYYATSFCEPV
jgi:AmmeMemoRadiSam system protein A